MKCPIKIIETKASGKRREWTLQSERQLAECIAAAMNYESFQIQAGRLVVTEADGDLTVEDRGAFTLEAYLDWLNHDLQMLYFEEIQE